MNAVITPARLPRGKTPEELACVEIQPTQWIRESQIPEGVTLLAGPPKTGKSALAEYITIEVASTGKKVLHFCLEYSETTLAKRIQKLSVEARLAATAQFYDQYEIDDAARASNRLTIVRDIVNDERPYLFVVDTLAQMKSQTRGDYDAEYRAVLEIKKVADDHRCSALLLHHTRKVFKDAGSDPRESVLGSQALAAGVDNVVILDRPDEHTRLRGFGRLIEDFETYLEYEDGRFTALDVSTVLFEQTVKTSPTTAKVLGVLRDGSDLDYAQITEKVNAGLGALDKRTSTAHVKNILKNQKEKGAVIYRKEAGWMRGRYSLPP